MCDKRLNANIWKHGRGYIETLDQTFWPVIAKHLGNSTFIFQDDNDPFNVSQLTTSWEKENDLDCLNWLLQSTDINISLKHIVTIKNPLKKIIYSSNM